MLPLPPKYLLNPAVGAAGLINIFPLPDIIVSAVLLSVKLRDICVVVAKVDPLIYIPPVGGSMGAVVKAVKTESTMAKFIQIGVDPIGNSSKEFSETLRSDIAIWSEAAKAANLKME